MVVVVVAEDVGLGVFEGRIVLVGETVGEGVKVGTSVNSGELVGLAINCPERLDSAAVGFRDGTALQAERKEASHRVKKMRRINDVRTTIEQLYNPLVLRQWQVKLHQKYHKAALRRLVVVPEEGLGAYVGAN